MHIGIHHTINNAQSWDQNVKNIMNKVEKGTLPAGLKPVLFIPATNKKTTFCLWEGDSTNSVREFIDRETGDSARNEYFEVDTKNTVGLPAVPAGKH